MLETIYNWLMGIIAILIFVAFGTGQHTYKIKTSRGWKTRTNSNESGALAFVFVFLLAALTLRSFIFN